MGGKNASRSPEEGWCNFFVINDNIFIAFVDSLPPSLPPFLPSFPIFIFIDPAMHFIFVWFIPGADTPVYCALLPKGTTSPNGEFLQNREIVPWLSGN